MYAIASAPPTTTGPLARWLEPLPDTPFFSKYSSWNSRIRRTSSEGRVAAASSGTGAGGEGGGEGGGEVGKDPGVGVFDVEQRRGWRLGDAPRLVHHEIRRDRDDQSDHEKPGDHRHRRRSLGATHQGPALLASSSSRRAAPVSSCSARPCARQGDR